MIDKTETMVERVARAIYHGTKPKKPWDDRAEEYKDAFRVQARFAIDAMREPTQVMLAAGDGQLEKLEDAEAVLSAMIDAALKESE